MKSDTMPRIPHPQVISCKLLPYQAHLSIHGDSSTHSTRKRNTVPTTTAGGNKAFTFLLNLLAIHWVRKSKLIESNLTRKKRVIMLYHAQINCLWLKSLIYSVHDVQSLVVTATATNEVTEAIK